MLQINQFKKKKMQNLLFFDPALLVQYQMMQSMLLYQNNPENMMLMPVISTELLSNQNSPAVPSNQFSSIPLEKPQQVTLSAEFQTNSHAIPPKSKKVRKQFHSKTEEEQQFKVRTARNTEQISYKKKNTESNIVNQTFSYLSSDRSRSTVSAFFQKDVQKINQFYSLMLKIRQSNKKYINRKYLKRLIEFESGSQFFRVYSKSKIISIGVPQIREILRILTYQFLRDQINISLLTSSKIYKDTLFEHFWRKREVMKFLFGNNSNNCA